MDINQHHSGSGDNVAGDKIVNINAGPAPKILEAIFLDSTSDKDGYKSHYSITVGFPSQNFMVKVNQPDVKFPEKPVIQRSGIRIYSGGQMPCTTYLIATFTKQQQTKGSLIFSV